MFEMGMHTAIMQTKKKRPDEDYYFIVNHAIKFAEAKGLKWFKLDKGFVGFHEAGSEYLIQLTRNLDGTAHFQLSINTFLPSLPDFQTVVFVGYDNQVYTGKYRA